MESRGGITGGPTLTDYIAGYAREGYSADFSVRRDSRLLCGTCKRALDPREVTLRSLRRVEGVSDPADMGAIAALECPSCGARGTATFCFGPSCPPEQVNILLALDNQRPTRHARDQQVEDASLVRDTGWLPGSRDG